MDDFRQSHIRALFTVRLFTSNYLLISTEILREGGECLHHSNKCRYIDSDIYLDIFAPISGTFSIKADAIANTDSESTYLIDTRSTWRAYHFIQNDHQAAFWGGASSREWISSSHYYGKKQDIEYMYDLMIFWQSWGDETRIQTAKPKHRNSRRWVVKAAHMKPGRPQCYDKLKNSTETRAEQ